MSHAGRKPGIGSGGWFGASSIALMMRDWLSSPEHCRPIAVLPFWANEGHLPLLLEWKKVNTLWNDDWQFGRKIGDAKKFESAVPSLWQVDSYFFDPLPWRLLAEIPPEIDAHSAKATE